MSSLLRWPPPSPRHAPDVARALVWALVAVVRVRRRLAVDGGVSAAVVPPHGIALGGARGVRWGTALPRATCLERSLVLQAWEAAHGRRRAVVIGVAKDGASTVAHAWLEGEAQRRPYVEMTRVAPP